MAIHAFSVGLAYKCTNNNRNAWDHYYYATETKLIHCCISGNLLNVFPYDAENGQHRFQKCEWDN